MKKIIRQISKINIAGFILIGATALCLAFITMQQGKQEKWTAPATADMMKNPVASNIQSIAAGKVIYTKNCYDCHGKKGKGDGPKSADLDKNPQDFTKEDFQKQTDGALFWKITEGRKPMASFKKDLSEEQRWQVINYVRTLEIKK
jgi:mono/diheme cytochrome c family protein